MVVRADKTWWETGEARNIVDQMVEGQKCWALGCGDGVRVRASLGFLTGQFRALWMPNQVYHWHCPGEESFWVAITSERVWAFTVLSILSSLQEVKTTVSCLSIFPGLAEGLGSLCYGVLGGHLLMARKHHPEHTWLVLKMKKIALQKCRHTGAAFLLHGLHILSFSNCLSLLSLLWSLMGEKAHSKFLCPEGVLSPCEL